MVFALAGVQRRARELVAGCHSQQGSPVLPEKLLSTTVLYGRAGGWPRVQDLLRHHGD